MNPISFQSAPMPPPPGPPRFPMLPPEPSNSSSFWENRNVSDRLREVQDALNLAKAMYVVLFFSLAQVFVLTLIFTQR